MWFVICNLTLANLPVNGQEVTSADQHTHTKVNFIKTQRLGINYFALYWSCKPRLSVQSYISPCCTQLSSIYLFILHNVTLTTPLELTTVHVQCNQAAYTANPLLQNSYLWLQMANVCKIYVSQFHPVMLCKMSYSNVFISKCDTSLVCHLATRY